MAMAFEGRFLLMIFVVVSVLGNSCARLLQLKDNSYQGIIVAIAPHVPESKGTLLINAIKDHFKNASRVLFKATHQHASFGHVTIVVPTTWTRTLVSKTAFYSYNEAHVRVEDPSPIHGNTPYTLQTGGCGQQGEYIHLTPDYLLNSRQSQLSYGDPGKVLVHEWAHFRYGVFDEYGYPGDPLYPHVYVDGDNPQLTACTSPQVDAEFNPNCKIDQSTGLYNSDCTYRLGNTQATSSSLMSMHFLPNVDSFCKRSNHQDSAPTKQNVLCDGKSVWEVMMNHQDFENYTESAGTANPPVVQFEVVRTKRSPVLVVLDRSNQMKGNERFDFVQKAVQIFVHILSEETRVGLMTYSDIIDNLTLELKPLTTNHKSKFGGADVDTNAATFETTLMAIDQARQNLSKEGGGIVLLISAGAAPGDDKKVFELCNNLQRDNVRVMSILYPSYPSFVGTMHDYLTLLGDRSNGRNFFIQEKAQGFNTNLDVLAQLTSAMFNIAEVIEPSPEDSYSVHSEKSFNTETVVGRIYVDKSSGPTKIMIITKHQSDIDIYKFKLSSPSRSIVKQFYNSEFAVHKFAFVYALDASEPGWWNYEFKLKKTQTNQPTISIFVYSHHGSTDKPITVKSWTSAEMSTMDITKTPLILYAQVTRGKHPIANAKVVAKIQTKISENDYNTTFLDLSDNGNGDPDIVKNDGIYSRYFTEFNTTGHYVVSVFVEDTQDSIVVSSTSASSSILPVDENVPRCCGSVVPIKNSTPSDHFSRVSNTGVVTIAKLPQIKFNPLPSTIRDLKIEKFDPLDGRVTFNWTAPGEDFDSGTAAGYKMFYSEFRHELLNSNNVQPANEVASNVPPPSESGKTDRLTVTRSLDSQSKVIYYSVQTVEKSGKPSKLSNIVAVRFPAAITTTSTAISGITNTAISPTSVGDGSVATRGGLSMVAISIIAVSCVLFLFLLILFLICLRRKQKRAAKTATAKKTSSDRPDPRIFKSPGVDDNADKTTTNHGNGHIYSVSEQMSPQFMSASEILDKQVQQRRIQREEDYLNEDMKPPVPEEENFYSPTYEHINTLMPNNYYTTQPNNYYPVTNNNPFINNPSAPYGRTSLSDKPSSSFTSLSTNEPRKDNGYFTSYEENSDDSQSRRQTTEPPLSASKTSLTRRVVAESQV